MTTLQLPYLPHPYPDEILGSWLARISLHNGTGGWLTLLERAGYSSMVLGRSLFNLVDYAERLETLLALLGTGYERAMIEMTTLPYWLAFDATTSQGVRLQGTRNIPGLANWAGKDIVSLGQFKRAHTSGTSLLARFCPRCIDQDHTTWGEPYWHRAHQLPNVFYCPDHFCALQTSCPNCSIAIGPHVKGLVELPRLRCVCGQDLRVSRQEGPVPDSYLKLSQISAQVLLNGIPQWDRRQVRTQLRHLLRQGVDSSYGRYQSILTNTFNVKRDGSPSFYAHIQGQEKFKDKLKLAGYLCHATAPDCCALLVALGLDFDAASRRFLQEMRDPQEDNRHAPESRSVELTREEILGKAGANPKVSLVYHREPYWFLRIHDFDWLQRTFPNIKTRQMPNVDEDRAEVESILRDITLSNSLRRQMAQKNAAGVRAKFRDHVWFYERLNTLAPNIVQRSNAKNNKRPDSLAVKVEQAIQTILNDEGPPIRITAKVIGSITGLSENQVRHVAEKHPHLRTAISAVNLEKPRRQLLWAAQQLHAKGHSLSIRAICAHARLPTTSANCAIVRDCIAALEQNRDSGAKENSQR